MKKQFIGLILLVGLSACLSFNAPPVPLMTPDTTNRADETASHNPTPQIGTPDQIGTHPPIIDGTVQNTEVALQSLPTPYIELLYRLQPGSPKSMQNFVHPESGCKSMGIGGQIFDAKGNPVSNIVVKLNGILNDNIVEMISLSGGAIYLGPGGYEFKLADQPMESIRTLWLTLFDDQGNAISEPITFSTFASCEQNFTLINFLQMQVVKNSLRLFLPFVDTERLP